LEKPEGLPAFPEEAGLITRLYKALILRYLNAIIRRNEESNVYFQIPIGATRFNIAIGSRIRVLDRLGVLYEADHSGLS
jgi:hypothetical protein